MASKTGQVITLPDNFTAWISDHRVGKVSSLEQAVERLKKVPADARLRVTQKREGRNHNRRRTGRTLSFSALEILLVLQGPTSSRDFTCHGGRLYLVVPPPKVPVPLRLPGTSLMEALYGSEQPRQRPLVQLLGVRHPAGSPRRRRSLGVLPGLRSRDRAFRRAQAESGRDVRGCGIG